MKGCRSGQAPPTGELAARLGRRESERKAIQMTTNRKGRS